MRQCAAGNMPLPSKIADAPTLMHGLELYWFAFIELNTDRQIGYGEGPIGWSSIMRWADYHEIDDYEQRADLHRYLSAMDAVYLKFRADKIKEK